MFRYLHYLRHYRDKRLEAGYHHLDKSRLEARDLTVSHMAELEEAVRRSEREVGDLAVVETPHVTVAWEGLEEVKQLSSSLGQILSSSCIPSLSTVGKVFT